MTEYHMTGIAIEFMLIMCAYYCFKDIKKASNAGAAFRSMVGILLILVSVYGAFLITITLVM
ncbi:hypothetical protein NVI2019_GHJFPKLH_01364 [Providencia alcalifaciens]|nr:hypothetical protein NVI2019_GHJFPKLH_01364 [Providencia alcalifaciens]